MGPGQSVGASSFMTWKRVATAVLLAPLVVGLVLWGSTAIVSLVIALVTLLGLFEYFALGEAIGHRAYRFWTATSPSAKYSNSPSNVTRAITSDTMAVEPQSTSPTTSGANSTAVATRFQVMKEDAPTDCPGPILSP